MDFDGAYFMCKMRYWNEVRVSSNQNAKLAKTASDFTIPVIYTIIVTDESLAKAAQQ